MPLLKELLEDDALRREWGPDARRLPSGERLLAALRSDMEGNARVRVIRGRGLMIGVELAGPAAAVQLACEREGLLVGLAGPNVIRLLPPLNVADEETDRAVAILSRALRESE